jgi:hypothetical protein
MASQRNSLSMYLLQIITKDFVKHSVIFYKTYYNLLFSN